MKARPPERRLSSIFSAAKWRRWLRALHRDAGFLAIGLTFVYAFSGLAVNHIADWDPNFRNIDDNRELPEQVAPPQEGESDIQVARRVLHGLEIDEEIGDVYRPSSGELDITLEHLDVHVDFDDRRAFVSGQKERFLLRAANFLHLNRGKRAWTWIADGYAVLLLVLASSGLFMVKGRQGFLGRGGLIFVVGASIPVLYVVLSSP